jgi:hypothetical protein
MPFVEQRACRFPAMLAGGLEGPAGLLVGTDKEMLNLILVSTTTLIAPDPSIASSSESFVDRRDMAASLSYGC